MKKSIVISLLLLTVMSASAKAQNDPDLDQLDQKLTRHIETKMPGWKHRRTNPIQGSQGVLIDHWQNEHRIVNVSVTRYRSANEARDVMQPFIQYASQKEELKGFGDQAYAWGYGLSNIMLRKGRFIISLDAFADVDSDSDARNLTPIEKGTRERAEIKRLTREFLKHVDNALNQP